MTSLKQTYSWNETLRPLSIIHRICWNRPDLTETERMRDLLWRYWLILIKLNKAHDFQAFWMNFTSWSTWQQQGDVCACSYLPLGHQFSLSGRCSFDQSAGGCSDGFGCFQNLFFKVKTLISFLLTRTQHTFISMTVWKLWLILKVFSTCVWAQHNGFFIPVSMIMMMMLMVNSCSMIVAVAAFIIHDLCYLKSKSKLGNANGNSYTNVI